MAEDSVVVSFSRGEQRRQMAKKRAKKSAKKGGKVLKNKKKLGSLKSPALRPGLPGVRPLNPQPLPP